MDPYLHAHREEEPQVSPAAVTKRPTEPLISIIGASLGTTPRSVSAAVAAAPRTASAAHGGSAAARPLATAQPLHHQAAVPIANAAAMILGTTTKTSASNARPPLQLPSRQQGQSTQSTASSVLHSIDPKSVDSKSLDVKGHSGAPKRSPRRSPRRQSPAVSIAESAVTPNTGRAGQDAHRPPSHEDARRGGSGSVSAAVAAALGPHLTGKSASSGIATANDAASKRGPHATARTPSDLPTTISDSIIPERSETKPNATLHRGGAQHGGHLPPRGINAGLLGSSRTGIAGVSATPTGSATPGLLDNIGAPSLRASNASAHQPNRVPYVANFSRLLADNSVAGENSATRALHHQNNQGDTKGGGGGGIHGRDVSSVRREIPTHPSAGDVPPQHRDQLLQFGQHGDIGHLGAGLVSSAHREASVNGNVGFLESSAAARGQVPHRKAIHSASMVDTTLNENVDAETRGGVAADQGIAVTASIGEEDQVSAFDRLKTLRIHAARDKEVLLGRIEELSSALMQSQHRANLSDEEVKSYHEHFGSLDDFAARQVVQQEELLAAKKKLRAAIERANEAEAEADDLRRGIAAERAHIARHHYNIQTNQVLPAQIHQAPVNASRGPSAASGLISTSDQGGARDPSPTSAQQCQSASQLPLDGQTGGGGSGVGGVGVVTTAPGFGGAPEQFAASSTVPLIVVDPHAKLAHLESRLATALAESSLLQDEAASVCRTFAAKRAHIAASRKQKRLRDATEKLRGIAKKAAEMEANSDSLNNNGNGDGGDGDGGGVRPETLPYRMTKEAIAAEIAQEDRRREDEDAFIDHETERALWQERGQLAEIDRLLSQKTTLVEQLDAAVDAARAELQHRQDDPQQSFPHTATMPQIAALLDAAPAASRGASNHPLITPGTQAGVIDDANRGVSAAAAGAPVAAASGLPSHSQSPVLVADPSVSGGGVGGDIVGGSAPIVDPSNQGSVHAASQQPSHVPSQSQSVQPNDPSRHGSVGGGSHAGGAAGSVVGGSADGADGGVGQNDGTGLVASAAQSTTSQPAVPIAITRAELEHKMVHALASKEWMKLVNVGTYEVSYKNNTTGKIVPDLAREMAEELRREHAARHRAQLAADGDAVAAAAAAVSSPSVPHAGNSSLAQGVHGDGRSLSTALVPSPQQRRDGSTGSGSNALVASKSNFGPAGGGGGGGLSNAALIDSNNEIAAAAAELRAQRDQSLAAVRLAEAATHTALSQVRSLAEKNKALKDENETVRKLLLRVAKAGLIGAPTRASTQEAAAAAAAAEAAAKANAAAAAAAASARGLSSSDPPPPGGDDDGPPPPSSDPSGEGAASGAAEQDGDGKPPVDPEMERLKSEVTVPLRMPGLPRLTPPELPATLDRERLAERAGRLEEDNDALRHRVVELSVEAAKKEDRLQALEETIRKLMPE